ncbi:MAG: hypothetical protein U1C46_04365 [Bacteroidales bacterium]|nr:hypothetical protein [Bacteroidales bacterium]
MKPIKLKYLSAFSVITALLLSLNSCKDDEYDFNSIEPVVIAITGDAMVAAHGLTAFPTKYTVPHRGGSTFKWTITSPAGNSTIVPDPKYQSIVYVTFPQASDTSSAIIKVVETTMGGKESPAATKNVVLTPFCPYNMDAFVGQLKGTSANNDPILYASKTANLNELVVKGLAGFINFSWGENWTVGDGSCLLKFSCGQLVKIERQKIGETDYPDIYFIEGSGTINPAATSITVSYRVYYTGGNTSLITTTLTKLPKSGIPENTEPFIILKK